MVHEAEQLARKLNKSSSAKCWNQVASHIKSAANKHLYDSQIGLYRDNETTTLYPHDGNVWAIKAILALSGSQSETISKALHSRWGRYGSHAPEAGATISPFIGGFELQAHYIAGRSTTALDLIRRQLGFMLEDPRMT